MQEANNLDSMKWMLLGLFALYYLFRQCFRHASRRTANQGGTFAFNDFVFPETPFQVVGQTIGYPRHFVPSLQTDHRGIPTPCPPPQTNLRDSPTLCPTTSDKLSEVPDTLPYHLRQTFGCSRRSERPVGILKCCLFYSGCGSSFLLTNRQGICGAGSSCFRFI